MMFFIPLFPARNRRRKENASPEVAAPRHPHVKLWEYLLILPRGRHACQNRPSMGRITSAERVSAADISDNYVFQRSLLAYRYAAERVSGRVLEIGTGSGYGLSVISPSATIFLTLDKHVPPADLSAYLNVEFRHMKVPPLTGIESGVFDYVVMFQVIEHIKNDFLMLSEIARVLRPGGKLIITTPNREMSLTRNPWHVREYTAGEFSNLLGCFFGNVEALGVFGGGKVMEYYEENRRSVARISRLDILRMRQWLPKPLMRIPYDILNRMNRRKLLSRNGELTSGIRMEDYHIAPAGEGCFDLLYVAEKM